MLNVTDEVKTLFKTDSILKTLEIRIPGKNLTLGNEDILTESMTLKESIESSDNLSFTGCIASCFSFECFDFVTDVIGQKIEADIKVSGNTIPLFRGYIDEVTNLTHEDFTKKIVAYDVLYTINNKDVTSWWNSISFPITCINLRNSFFNYVGVQQVDDYLPNDSMPIYNTIDDEVVSGETIIKNICQINGRFGQINREGKFIYRHLTVGTEALYPREDLYPDEDVFPSAENAVDSVSKGHYTKISYENYEVAPITAVQIMGKSDEVIGRAGTGINVFTVSGNPFVYGLADANGVAQQLLLAIQNLWYVPADIDSVGLPYVECGDFVMCATRRSIVRAYVLTRTLKGIQVLTDSFEASGDKYQPVYVSNYQSTTTAAVEAESARAQASENATNANLNKEINNRVEAVNGCYSTIQQTATQIRTEVSNADNSLNSRITQTATEIRLEVNNSVNGLSSRIDMTDSNITIQAQRIDLKADTTYVDNLVATKASVSSLEAANARIDSLAAKRSFSGTVYVGALNCGGATFTSAKTINTFNSAGKYLGQITVLAVD